MKLAGRRQTADERRAQFDALLQPLLPSLYRGALSFVRDPTDAEDALQETVLRAYRAFEQFEPGTSFKAWVFRILTNHCINRFRRRERGPEAVAFGEVEREAELAGSEQQSSAALPDAALMDQMLDEEVERALAKLPPEFRLVVLLSDLQEHSYQEAADLLGIPIGTVRSRLFRGRRLLREALAGYAVERGLIREADIG